MSGQIPGDELLNMLGSSLSRMTLGSGKGELVIAGSGIAPLRQMTLESIQYLRGADIVFHSCQTAAEEAFIRANSKDSFDLRCLYGPSKPRQDTYIQMAEVMMRSVRAGKLVVGILYGHPGIFATPGHRAIAIARSEGYSAKMLPGVSAEDNLLADLGIEPALPGTAQFEASALVYNKMEMDTGLHTLIWQPGSVGKATMEMNNNNLILLIEFLEDKYGNEHPIYVYRAGVLPGEASHISHHTTVELRNPDVQLSISPSSTLYIPPKKAEKPAADEQLPSLSAYRRSYPAQPVAPLYGERETRAVGKLDSYLETVARESAAAKKEDKCIPGQYNPDTATPAMQRAAIQMAMNHHNLPEDPQGRLAVVGEVLSELTEEEKAACMSTNPFSAEGFMRARQNAGEDADQRQAFSSYYFLTVFYDDGTIMQDVN